MKVTRQHAQPSAEGRNPSTIEIPVPEPSAQRNFDPPKTVIAALKARRDAICQAYAAPRRATPVRLFAGST